MYLLYTKLDVFVIHQVICMYLLDVFVIIKLDVFVLYPVRCICFIPS